MRAWPGVIETYRKYLPVTDKTPVVTLHEGNTPLLPAPPLSSKGGCAPLRAAPFEGAGKAGARSGRS